MATESPRRLNLLDLIVLIVGCAGGLSIGRYCIGIGAHRAGYIWGPERLAVVLAWGYSQGLALTVTLLVLRIRRPRPSWRDLMKQPGLVACLVVTMARLLSLQQLMIYYFQGQRLIAIALMLDGVGFGYTVLVAWVTLRLSGGWTPEAGAIDRLGRLVGWGWIAVYAIMPLIRIWVI